MDIYLTLIPLKTCSCCGVSKEISLFNKRRSTKDGLQIWCKDCVKAYQKARYQANPEKIKAYDKAWKKANPDKVKAYNKAHRETYKDEPWFKVMESQSCRIHDALKGIKMVAPAKELVGGWAEMAAHLESKFHPGMTWDNYGHHGSNVWHIDHIKPCASFDFNDPKQQHECFHYTNTQPLWAADNIAKG